VSRGGSTADDLLARGADVAARLLRDNADRWETLSAADRARVERVAHHVAERLLRRPALVLDAAEQAGDDVRVDLARTLLDLRPRAPADPDGPVGAGQGFRTLPARQGRPSP
jgi:hypothetical protein